MHIKIKTSLKKIRTAKKKTTHRTKQNKTQHIFFLIFIYEGFHSQKYIKSYMKKYTNKVKMELETKVGL